MSMSMRMRKYKGKEGKEIFGTLSKAYGLEHLSSTTMDDSEFLQVRGSSPVLRQRHVEEFDSEISELQGRI